MRGDTRFYSSNGSTVFCGHCDRKECGRHYKNKDKYPWRYYKGWSTVGLRGHKGCCDYESPEKTKKIVAEHLKGVKVQKKIDAYKRKILALESEIW